MIFIAKKATGPWRYKHNTTLITEMRNSTIYSKNKITTTYTHTTIFKALLLILKNTRSFSENEISVE
jgi:hypothetical protein